MNKNPTRCVLLLALATLFLAPPGAAAQSPWRWQMNMKGDPNGDGIMIMPTSVFVDTQRERYYVTDSGNNRLVSFDRSGKQLDTFNADNSLQKPFDMVRDANGTIWIVEKGKNSLTEINFSAKKTAAHVLQFNGQRIFPDRIAYAFDSFLVLDKASGGIFFFDKQFKAKKRLTCPDCTTGFIDFKVSGNDIWALDQVHGSVYRLSAEGDLKLKIILDDKLRFPYSIAIGPRGLIYVLDRHSAQVHVFDQNGKVQYRFLGPGHVREKLYYPTEILFDPWQRLCIVDEGNGRVEVFSR